MLIIARVEDNQNDLDKWLQKSANRFPYYTPNYYLAMMTKQPKWGGNDPEDIEKLARYALKKPSRRWGIPFILLSGITHYWNSLLMLNYWSINRPSHERTCVRAGRTDRSATPRTGCVLAIWPVPVWQVTKQFIWQHYLCLKEMSLISSCRQV